MIAEARTTRAADETDMTSEPRGGGKKFRRKELETERRAQPYYTQQAKSEEGGGATGSSEISPRRQIWASYLDAPEGYNMLMHATDESELLDSAFAATRDSKTTPVNRSVI